MGLLNKTRTVVIPISVNSEATYAKLYEMFTSEEMQHYLWSKIAELASNMPNHVATEKHQMIAMEAGEINFAQFLLYDLPNELKRKMEEKRNKETPMSISQKYGT